jgi:hypothetical protein
MSTRSMIAIPVDDGNAAIGRYHHSDGYPTGLGVALITARKAFPTFSDMVKALIFDHPGGWLTIVGTDWTIEPGYVNSNPDDDDIGRCCEHPYWRHYRQYYERNGAATPPVSNDPARPAVMLGHSFVANPKPTDARPQCYCHGDGSDTDTVSVICITEMDTDWCAGIGCDPLFMEWQYRLYPQGIEVWESRQPDPETTFRHYRRARVDWDVARPGSAMADIQAGEDLRTLQWATQMDALATAVKALREEI